MTHATVSKLLFALALAAVAAGTATSLLADDAADSRTFRFSYAGKLSGMPAGAQLRVWLPVPQPSEHQQVQRLRARMPARPQVAEEPTYGNRILSFQTSVPNSGEVSFDTTYRITRREVRGLGKGTGAKLSDEQRKLFLSAHARVPVEGRPLDLLSGLQLPDEPLALGRVLYDRVDEHVRYDKSQPGYGNGDVLWVCDSRFGNCTDFHSLFMTFTRARGVPARFEIGFPLPPERGEGQIGGYHCWASFHVDGHGWVPVDISEADKHPQMKDYYFGNLTADRVTFTVGRDITLVPPQAGEPLNFFVYPYAELEGEPLPSEQMQLEFTYADE